jgi:DNA polymerase-1
MPQRLYLIDGHAQIYRAYYAPFRDLTAPSGEPTRATHVFCQMLLNLIRDRSPDYLAMVMDVSDETVFRKDIYPAYKANREPSPEDLSPQIDRIVSILQTARVPILRTPGYEADDILATLARRHASDGLHVHIVSRDKDLEQLLSERVTLYDPLKDEEITPQRLRELKGWSPEQAIEAQILMGDTVDNIPGVKGIGAKTAAKLLEKYGSALGVIEHAGELTPKQRENVLAFAPQVETARRLVTLNADTPIDFELEAARCERFTWRDVLPIFGELGFRRLMDQAPVGSVGVPPVRTRSDAATQRRSDEGRGGGTEGRRHEEKRDGGTAGHRDGGESARQRAQGAEQKPDTEPRAPASAGAIAQRTAPAVRDAEAPPREGREGSLVSQSTLAHPSSPPWASSAPHGSSLAPPAELAARLRDPAPGVYQRIGAPDALARLADALAAQPAFAFDTETSGTEPIDAELVGVSLSWEVGKGYYIPVRSIYGEPLPLESLRERLAPIFASAGALKVGQNLKYDLIVLELAGLPVAGPLFDTMIAAFTLEPAEGGYGLSKLVQRHFGHAMTPISELIGKGRDQLRMDQVPLDHITEYAGEDADYTWRLKELYEPLLAGSDLAPLFYETEMPLVRVLAEMETAGINLDAAFLAEMSREMASRANALIEQVHELAGQAFNLDSPKQLAEVLFDKLGFRVVKRTKTARSTDADTLAALEKETGAPLLRLLLEFRELQKLRGTYVDALPRARSRRTGRVHTSYHQTGAITGRLSSSEPNLQNIPVRTQQGREIRKAFIPRSRDELLIVADYSQVELRILADFSRDEALIDAFNQDHDIHVFVAAQVNGVALADVTPEMRSRAKAVNFGIVYGQTAFGLSQATGMSRGEAQAFIDDYFRRYARIRAFIDQCIGYAKRDGFVRTMFGRRRPIPDINSRNRQSRALAERLAVNTVIQGSAADLIKRAMIRLHERIHAERLPLRMLLQVHDELVCEAPRAAAPAMAGVIADIMSGAMELRTPLKVDVSLGENWLEAK